MTFTAIPRAAVDRATSRVVTVRTGDTAQDCAEYDADHEACIAKVPYVYQWGSFCRPRVTRDTLCVHGCPCFRRRTL